MCNCIAFLVITECTIIYIDLGMAKYCINPNVTKASSVNISLVMLFTDCRHKCRCIEIKCMLTGLCIVS